MGCYLLIAVTLVAFPAGSPSDGPAVRLTVQPMPEPRPALKYQLLPELKELQPGNAAQNYLKCFMEQRVFFFSPEGAAERAHYQAMPLSELPVNTLRNYGGGALRNADWSARLDTVDWQVLDRLRDGGKETLADELGPFQLLAAAVQVRFRAEVAARDFDRSLRHAKTMLALARHLGEHPSELAGMVGLWTGRLALGTLEEMLQQSGCPNLYWALSDMPVPLVDLRRGVQGDRAIVAADLRLLRDDSPMTDAELDAFVSQWSGRMGFAREQSGLPPRNLRQRLERRVDDAARVKAARQRLVEAGYAPELVKSFSSTQVILVDEKRDYEIARDDCAKLLTVPLWQIDTLLRGPDHAPIGDGLFADLLPHTVKLRRTQARLEQQIAVLRHVEALRMFAARHDGKLPKSLAEITLPLPIDPVSGQPFVYQVDGATAHIRGEPLKAGASEPGEVLHYMVTLK